MNSAELIIIAIVAIAFAFGLATFQANLRRLQRTVDRMEMATVLVASDLAATAAALRVAAKQRVTQGQTLDRMEQATEVVASNLADSVSRADATEGPDGAAADAALRTGDSAEAITQRQEEARE